MVFNNPFIYELPGNYELLANGFIKFDPVLEQRLQQPLFIEVLKCKNERY
jgi:hypothetical protein